MTTVRRDNPTPAQIAARRANFENARTPEAQRRRNSQRMVHEEGEANRLREQGFQVFSPTVVCDRVAIRDGVVYFVEFKKMRAVIERWSGGGPGIGARSLLDHLFITKRSRVQVPSLLPILAGTWQRGICTRLSTETTPVQIRSFPPNGLCSLQKARTS